MDLFILLNAHLHFTMHRENWAVKPVKPENVPNLQHNSQINNKLFVHN